MRIRTIKPEFWISEDIARLSDKAKLLAIGLLNYSDDEGYFLAKPNLILAAIFPHELDTPILMLLDELKKPNAMKESYIDICIGKNGGPIGRVVKFNDHQCVNKPKPSKFKLLWVDSTVSSIPTGPFRDEYGTATGTVPEECSSDTGGVPAGTGKGKEQGTGKGKDTMSPSEDEQKKYAETDSVIDHLNEKAGSKYLHKKSAREPIHGRLEDGHSVDDCKLVIDFKVNDWLGTDQEQYIRPLTLFGPKKFEGYLFAAQRWVKAGRPHKRGLKEFERVETDYPEGEEI